MSEPVTVDARGLRCPLPVIRLARVARDLPDGATVTVLATDPAARHDVPAWARMRGHTILAVEDADDGVTAISVRLGAAPTP
ncbi:sulfurtransferase TusA family protein [Cellulomonas timonensis]|uniref:sulfurtransferase TusA family protein n=1 Tax=Cellulomonas timonensis TaxID=1689271 RepID=UPI00082AB28F|nr:sulfurtransferase TusA family protein [Cellulomonas timonensis]